MKNGFDAEKDLSQVSPQTSEPELTPRQNKIYRNLQDIGPEIAAFYLDGVKILKNKEIETAANLLAHVAREIDGGLRQVLAEEREEELEFVIRTPNHETLTYEKKREDTIKFDINTPGTVKLTYKKIAKHKPSILQSLDIDEPSPIAERWIEVTGQFNKFVHRHGPWKFPRSREEFEHLWYDFEDVLADLVGSYLNLLSRLDRILAYKAPTEEIIKTLPNLLKSDARRAYFFRELKYPTWLKPLKEAGWFNPDKNPLPYEAPEGPEYHRTPVWYALEYVETIANHPERPIDLLVDIVDAIVDYTNDTGKRIENGSTDRRLIKIIGTLPIDRIGRKHITFMDTVLKSSGGWASDEIGEIILPKFLSEGEKGLFLDLLKVMLDAKVVNHWIHPVMEEYCLKEVIKQQEQAISELCGLEAAQIALERIRTLVDEGAYLFDCIERIETESSDDSQQRYAELLVNFTCRMFRLASSDRIAETVKFLLKEGVAAEHDYQDAKGSPAIFGRIALNVITHHYDDLKRLFWGWEGNPLEEYELVPEIYQLIQTHCLDFDEDEIEQILHWIESRQYEAMFTEDDEERTKAVARYKREWLTALMETHNEKVVAAYQKYEQINPAKIESPGFSRLTKIGGEEISPMTVAKLSELSNAEIAQYLNDFQEDGGWAGPTKRGLSDKLEECVKANPQRFTDDLQPFQGVLNLYQYAIMRGLLNAWHDKREFGWGALLEFIHQILSSEQFWTEQPKDPFNDRNSVISIAADLVAEGTRDDKHAFVPQLLPIAEKILMLLAEKAEPSMSTSENLRRFSALDSVKSGVFLAMVNYALRYARINKTEQGSRWPQTIRADFTKRLDRNVEPSFEFSFTLGNYLPNLLYLDKEWVVDNINHIFPQRDESHWEAAFSGYLFCSLISEYLYSLLKKRGDYQKALNTDFADSRVLSRLIEHVCTGWIEDNEALNDETSLIYQLINSDNPKLLSEMVHFFWRQRYNTPDKVKSKVRPAWRTLIKVLSQKNAETEYQGILGSLSGWLGLIDRIDAETLEWLKLSAKYVERGFDSASFVKVLREHVPQTPKEVGEIYLEMLNNEVYPDYAPTDIQEIVRTLYNQGYKEDADEICNLYAAAGFDFLRSLYEEYQN